MKQPASASRQLDADDDSKGFAIRGTVGGITSYVEESSSLNDFEQGKISHSHNNAFHIEESTVLTQSTVMYAKYRHLVYAHLHRVQSRPKPPLATCRGSA